MKGVCFRIIQDGLSAQFQIRYQSLVPISRKLCVLLQLRYRGEVIHRIAVIAPGRQLYASAYGSQIIKTSSHGSPVHILGCQSISIRLTATAVTDIGQMTEGADLHGGSAGFVPVKGVRRIGGNGLAVPVLHICMYGSRSRVRNCLNCSVDILLVLQS